jgi:hypothetical protein
LVLLSDSNIVKNNNNNNTVAAADKYSLETIVNTMLSNGMDLYEISPHLFAQNLWTILFG